MPVALAATLALTLSRPVAAADSVVTDIRVGVHAAATRIVLELTKQVAFSAFTLGDPKRVVIDLPEVGWQLPPEPLPAATGVFEKLRYGLFKPGNSRIVFDIHTPAAITQAFIIEPQGGHRYRLVVDLTPTSPQAFLQSVGAQPIRVTGVQPKPASDRPGLAPPPAPSPPATKTGAQDQASPFRLAPRKPEPKQHGAKHVIVIDPGHGGVDPGTIGISGIYEKHVTLAMARELKKRLEETGRFKVVLTRDRDIFIRLRDRVQIARDAKAELFISIHADTVKNKAIRGPAVYTLSEKASDMEAAELADKENKADLIAGIDLSHETPEVTNILIDLAQRESMNESARFATALIGQLKLTTTVLRNTHRFAGFAVLKAPDVPSVLMELGFLSNPNDERSLRSGKYRAQLATAVAKALDAHFVRVEEATRK
ncbi:MAG: N-acetylmuramoyl-L-alanine amidase [Rhodospirillales bacterium]|nr:N-acetylmuramoyl-L-alanine amidase [Rhodospirillales bacterium]